MESPISIKKKTKRKIILIIFGLVFILGSLLVLLALFIGNPFSFRKNDNFLPNRIELTVHLIAHSHNDLGWLKALFCLNTKYYI